MNETWVKVEREGVYFGQCSELCGARHGYMPIAVEVVSPAKYAAWVASKGGTMPGARASRRARQHRRLAGHRARRSRRGGTPTGRRTPPADAEPAIQQPAINQAATAQN